MASTQPDNSSPNQRESFEEYRPIRAKLILASKGLAMGIADVIPGVSGGTIALISGIYDHLIRAISSVQPIHAWTLLELIVFCWHRDRREDALRKLREIEWGFILPLALGILTAVTGMIFVIPFVLEHYSFYAFALFFGLIIFSITVPYKMMKHRVAEYCLIVGFAIVVGYVVMLSSVSDTMIRVQPLYAGHTESLETTTDQKGKWHLSIPVNEDESESASNPANPGVLQRWQAEIFLEDGEIPGTFAIDVLSATGTAGADEDLTPALSAGSFQARVVNQRAGNIGVFLKSLEYDEATNQLHVEGQLEAGGNHAPWFVFLSGALAICAMILPGISGAYILVLLGQYRFVTATGRDLANHIVGGLKTGVWDPNIGSELMIVGAFVTGMLIGIFSFVRLLKYILQRYHSYTMAALTGMMIGSLRYLWPPNHFQGGEMQIADWIAMVFTALIGAGLVFGLEYLAQKLGDPDPPVQG